MIKCELKKNINEEIVIVEVPLQTYIDKVKPFFRRFVVIESKELEEKANQKSRYR